MLGTTALAVALVLILRLGQAVPAATATTMLASTYVMSGPHPPPHNPTGTRTPNDARTDTPTATDIPPDTDTPTPTATDIPPDTDTPTATATDIPPATDTPTATATAPDTPS